jgi:hypothetical protein
MGSPVAKSLYSLCKELHKPCTGQPRPVLTDRNIRTYTAACLDCRVLLYSTGRIGPHASESARSSRRTPGGDTAGASYHRASPVLALIGNRSLGRERSRSGDGIHLRGAAPTLSAGRSVVQIEIRTEELRFPPQHHPPAPGASPQVPGASFDDPPRN